MQHGPDPTETHRQHVTVLQIPQAIAQSWCGTPRAARGTMALMSSTQLQSSLSRTAAKRSMR
jgi:hypothetical protein